MKPEYIIIHHSLTKDSGTVSWSSIRNHHVKNLGYRDIGYHFGIEQVTNPFDGSLSTETLMGRLPTSMGAHCVPRNRDSIGICLIGNFDETIPDPVVWDKALALCNWLQSQYSILVRNVLGHREAQIARTCPGKFFDLDRFRSDLSNMLWNKIG